MRAVRAPSGRDARQSWELALLGGGLRGDLRGVLYRRRLPSGPWALWLRVRVLAGGVPTRFCASDGFSGPAPRGARALCCNCARRRPAPAPARVLPVPCTRPAPPHFAHAHESLGPWSIVLASRLPARPCAQSLPRERPAASKTSLAAKQSPRGDSPFPGAQTPHLHRASLRSGPNPGAPAPTHPTIPPRCSVRRRDPPFHGSSISIIH